MKSIDRVVFGDNQFFGINHMSQDKAQQLTERFHSLESIFEVYRSVYECGVRAIMLNSNDRASEICQRFRDQAGLWPGLRWYPSIPYPHKYANLVAERGILPALNTLMFQDQSALSGLSRLAQGGLAMVSRDGMQMMRMLVDSEMRIFRDLDVHVVFVQNILTDMLLGLNMEVFFHDYCEHIRKKYGAMPGFITQNLPRLREALVGWGIHDVVICASINKIGYLMSPSREAYEAALAENEPDKYAVMAMSTLASGAVAANEAYAYVNRLNVQSIVFGASSRAHIQETVRLIGGATSA